MTIYLDVVLLENICMNYIILFATGVILKTKRKQIRLILSSTLGSVYAVLSYMSILGIYSSIILKIILSIVMVYIAFNAKGIKTLLKQLVIFYLISFAFGGCAFALLYIVRPQDILMKNGILIGTYPIKIALMGGILGFAIISIAFRVIKGKFDKSNMLCDMQIIFKEESISVKAMLDTGNMLKDPITGVPVVVVESNVLSKIIPSEILDNLKNIINGTSWEIISNMEESIVSRFRVIPFSSLGKENGLLLGFKSDSITINFNGEENKIRNVIVGIYDKPLTKNGIYNALVGLDMLNKGEEVSENEHIANIKV